MSDAKPQSSEHGARQMPKEKQAKTPTPRRIIFTLQKTKDKKPWKNKSRKKPEDTTPYLQMRKGKKCGWLLRNHASTGGAKDFKRWERNTNLGACTLQNYPPEGKERCFLRQKLRGSVASGPSLKETLNWIILWKGKWYQKRRPHK